MMKMQIEGYIHALPSSWGAAPSFHFLCAEHAENFVLICPHLLEFEIPEGFDIEMARLSVVEAKRAAAMIAFDREIAAIKATRP